MLNPSLFCLQAKAAVSFSSSSVRFVINVYCITVVVRIAASQECE